MAYDESYFSKPYKISGGSLLSGFNIVYIFLIFYVIYLISQSTYFSNIIGADL